jgi:endonuclease/exonuclease/phosphatase family metal-dependent hydrolase
MLKYALGAALLLALYLSAVNIANARSSGRVSDIRRVARSDLPFAGDTLTLFSWNLGYAGLGAGSDFKVDGGKHYFPPSRAAVHDNVAAIGAVLRAQAADVLLIQEVARAGPLNYWHDLLGNVDTAIAGADRSFFADLRTRMIPWPLHAEHGLAIYARRTVAGEDLKPLPEENQSFLGIKLRYAMVVTRLASQDGGPGWTIANVHFAAFDKGAAIRTRQLRDVMAWAQDEYRAGRHVVLGGDWNLQLVATSFPSTTEKKYLFWIRPLPKDILPAGWKIAADAKTPSVRTNEHPYKAGENYTTVIDGFIVSPNVAIDAVSGVDLHFQHSDHNPIRATLRAAS